MRASPRNLILGPKGGKYLLRDEFSDSRTAGSANGTLATDGINTRIVTDTESKLSIANGALTVAGGKASPAFGDPSIWWNGMTRTPGLMSIARASLVSGSGCVIGWDANQTTIASNGIAFGSGSVLRAQLTSGTDVAVGAYTASIYRIAVAVRATGAFYFIKGGAFTSWTLLWINPTANDATIYPAITNSNIVFTADFLRVPRQLWLPPPLASDGFSSWGVTDGLGHAEGIAGGLGVGGSGLVFASTLGTWGAAGGVASSSVLDVPTSMSVATLNAGTTNIVIGCDLTRNAGACGIVLRYVDSDNYIRSSHDGTSASLIKRVAGGDTSIIVAAATYVAGARLQVIMEGTSAQLFYNNAKIGSTSTISDGVLQTSTLCGIRTTNIANTLDNFTVYPRGTEGQYSILNKWSG